MARERFTGDGSLHGVLAVGIGRRRRGRGWRQEAVLSVFVEQKRHPQELPADLALPSFLEVQYRGRTYRVDIDVVELGAEPGETQGIVALGTQVQMGGRLAGTLAWFQSAGGVHYAVTAEHVVGLDHRGPVHIHPQGYAIGDVVQTAYRRHHIDAALIKLKPDWNYARILPFSNRPLGEPRVPTDADTYPIRSGPAGQVWLPSRQKLAPVRIRHLHVSGLEFRQPNGRTFKPHSLLLTDPCTQRGESGTLLLGPDRAPLGLLTGLRRDPHSGKPLYSCFTELVPALFALLG